MSEPNGAAHKTPGVYINEAADPDAPIVGVGPPTPVDTFIEASVGQWLQRQVFRPNDAATWSLVTGAVDTFLTGLRKDGILPGSDADASFGVRCGLNSTMTADDVLAGDMRFIVSLMLGDPPADVEIIFTQKMAG